MKRAICVSVILLCIISLCACGKKPADINSRIEQSLIPYLEAKGYHYQIKDNEIECLLQGDDTMSILWGNSIGKGEFEIYLSNSYDKKSDCYKNIPYEDLSDIVGCLSHRALSVEKLRKAVEDKRNFYNDAYAEESPEKGYLMKKTYILDSFDFWNDYKICYYLQQFDNTKIYEKVWYLETLIIIWHI